jgi:hypothetical protein
MKDSEYNDKILLIRGIVDAAPQWNDFSKKSACRALFWLCEQLIVDIEERANPANKAYLLGQLVGLRQYCDEWSHTGAINFEFLRDCEIGLTGDVPDDPLP